MVDKTEARRRLREIFQETTARGDLTGGFEQLYSEAKQNPDAIPWADLAANPHLLEWLEREDINGTGKTVVVVGCGLGDDAEALAKRGFTVTAFDISNSAVEWCKKRFPETKVQYINADLFQTPKDWAFDFVFECYTIQSLPLALRPKAIEAVAGLVAPDGHLLAIGRLVSLPEEQVGMPWPLLRSELDLFKSYGLTEGSFEDFIDSTGTRRFQVEYQR